MFKLPIALVRALGVVFLFGSSVVAMANVKSENKTQHANSGVTSQTYLQMLDQIDRELAALEELAASRENSWAMQERLATALTARGKLTGEMADFVAAREAIKVAFQTARKGAGPFMARASLNFTLHLLPLVEADLSRVESSLLVNNRTRTLINLTRADIDLYSARYNQAKKIYLEMEGKNPSVDTASRLANYFTQTGNFSAAEHWFDQTESRVVGYSPQLRAWVHLQKGILDLSSGRLDDALAHYEEALDIFPGYWLVEEHIAEIDALQGRNQMAEKKYRDLIERTGSPLFMVALSDVLGERDDSDSKNESVQWMKAAAERFEQQLQVMPEMVSGHALEHFIQFEEIERVLPMALDNYHARPAGESAVALVQALALAGQHPRAIALLEEILNTPYRSADLFATASILYLSLIHI